LPIERRTPNSCSCSWNTASRLHPDRRRSCISGSRWHHARAAAAARADGILVLDPVYAGPVVGYFCLVEDPDGNHVEFSYGQPINPRQLQDQLAPGPTKNDPRVP